MAEVLIDGRGSGNFAGVNEQNRLMVEATVSSVFVASGNVAITNFSDLGSSRVVTNFSDLGSSRVITAGSILEYEVGLTNTARNNPLNKFLYIISGTATGVTGSEIGSIIQFIGAGSFIQIFTWSNDLITQIGSWS